MKKYEYQAHVCENIVFGCLHQLRASGIPDNEIRVMMKCIGDIFARMSFDNKPIEYYMKQFEHHIEDIEDIDSYVKDKLSSIYGHMNNIDFPATTKVEKPENKLF